MYVLRVVREDAIDYDEANGLHFVSSVLSNINGYQSLPYWNPGEILPDNVVYFNTETDALRASCSVWRNYSGINFCVPEVV